MWARRTVQRRARAAVSAASVATLGPYALDVCYVCYCAYVMYLIVELGSSARTEIGVRSSGDAHFQIETSLIRFLLLTDKKESTFASLLTPTLKYFDHF